MEALNYQFSALRGIQAGREYYVAMYPLKLIAKIFLFDVVTLYGTNRAELPTSDLSAGEKQLYATALLWALG